MTLIGLVTVVSYSSQASDALCVVANTSSFTSPRWPKDQIR